MRKPVIGIVMRPYIDEEKYSFSLIPEKVRLAILKSGGIPYGIFPPQFVDMNIGNPKDIPPITEEEKKLLYEQLAQVDGVVMPGALKVYEYDRVLYDYLVQHDIPTLGICAGMQLMTMYNNSNQNSRVEHHRVLEEEAHLIQIKPNSLLYQIIEDKELMVNSLHSYQVTDPGELFVSAVSADGVIEAVEHPKCRFHVGVQWHPESLYEKEEASRQLFSYFIHICEKP